jgi:cytosine permease
MASLPDYVASAKPSPQANRVPWYKTTAQTYAGIMLWFVFWDQVPGGGAMSQGLGTAFLGLIGAALICHFLFYLVPGILGMQTGLPLYVVGTSTYGVQGGFIMPGLLMGLLQYGWLAVNAFFAGILLCAPFGQGAGTVAHAVVSTGWTIAAAFMGVMGIKYVARVATFLPLIPLVILIVLLAQTIGGVGSFDPAKIGTVATAPAAEAGKSAVAMSSFGVIALLMTVIVGFFATAGAAGTDIAGSNRDKKDVQLGGLVGVAGATIFAGGAALLIVAGAHGLGKAGQGIVNPTAMMGSIMGEGVAKVFWYLLAIAAFPPACFSSLIAANSFRTTLPQVKPIISCGLGTLVAIILAVTGYAGDAIGVFSVIGASFGPICGAMVADYLLSGCKWAGPRAGFNPAGWISWALGFVVGAGSFIGKIKGLEFFAQIPAQPVAAFVVGFVVYAVLAKIGMQSKTLEMPGAAPAPAGGSGQPA